RSHVLDIIGPASGIDHQKEARLGISVDGGGETQYLRVPQLLRRHDFYRRASDARDEETV
ncbi:MAG: hypothetical protein AAF327_20310, partial [Cyanobacteria bacterium P01_A01_bin.37]